MRRRLGAPGVLMLVATLLAPVPAEAAPTCFDRRATIVGTNGEDEIEGTNGADVIHGLGGRDAIDGRGGDDLICGGAGGRKPFPKQELLAGGPGDDEIRGEGGVDVARGGPGDDVVSGGPDDDYLTGEGGADVIRGGDGDDRATGGKGSDRVYGGPGSDGPMWGGDGLDTLAGGPGDDRLAGDSFAFARQAVDPDLLDGGPGSDWVFSIFDAGPMTVDLPAGRVTGKAIGTDELRSVENARGGFGEPDRFIGNELANHFVGRGGGDVIEGAGGDDVLEGWGDGAEVRGGAGDDLLFPVEGDALLDGGDGSDTVNLWTFTAEFYHPDIPCYPDRVPSGWSIDLAAGIARRADGQVVEFQNAENAIGSHHSDQIIGTPTDNHLRGLCGDDVLDGRDGVDILVGGEGTDTCVNGEELEACEPSAYHPGDEDLHGRVPLSRRVLGRRGPRGARHSGYEGPRHHGGARLPLSQPGGRDRGRVAARG